MDILNLLLGNKSTSDLAKTLSKKEKKIIKMFDRVDKMAKLKNHDKAIEALKDISVEMCADTVTFQLVATKWAMDKNVRYLAKLALCAVTSIGVVTDKAMELQKKLEEK